MGDTRSHGHGSNSARLCDTNHARIICVELLSVLAEIREV